MRPIEFRGKDTRANKWQYGDLTVDRAPGVSRAWISHTVHGEQGSYEVHHKTVGQYTGWHDGDMTKIFEGDVLDKNGELWTVEWKDQRAGFWIRNSQNRVGFFEFQAASGADEICLDQFIVVGSIHDSGYIPISER